MDDQQDQRGADPAALSFDPRTWGGAGGEAGRPAPTLAVDDTPVASVAVRSSGKPPLAVLLAGGAAAVALAGFGAWWAVGRSRPAAPPPTASAPATAPVAAAGAVRRSFVLSRLEDVRPALVAAGAPEAEVQAAVQAAAAALKATGELRVSFLAQPSATGVHLASLEARGADGAGVAVSRRPDGAMTAQKLGSDDKAVVKVIRGELDATSFYNSAVSAGVVDSLIPDFIQAFAFDFDLQRDIKPGDVFEAVFEQPQNGAGQAAGAPRLLFASLETGAKSRALYWFTPPGEQAGGWFDGEGRSTVRSLMKTPVNGARITSTFGPRVHPVLGYTRMHKGVDFATPVGTPVYASGDGVVDFEGVHGGHGNYLKVRHTKTLETAYAHLSAFGVANGAAVRQGQQIALSGNTGLSSGPHMHYEVIVNGEQVNPQEFVTDTGRTLTGDLLARFKAERNRIDAQRAAQNG